MPNSELQGQIGEVRMTVHITRKDTGRVDTYELVGKVEQTKETDHGGDTLDGSEKRGD